MKRLLFISALLMLLLTSQQVFSQNRNPNILRDYPIKSFDNQGYSIGFFVPEDSEYTVISFYDRNGDPVFRFACDGDLIDKDDTGYELTNDFTVFFLFPEEVQLLTYQDYDPVLWHNFPRGIYALTLNSDTLTKKFYRVSNDNEFFNWTKTVNLARETKAETVRQRSQESEKPKNVQEGKGLGTEDYSGIEIGMTKAQLAQFGIDKAKFKFTVRKDAAGTTELIEPITVQEAMADDDSGMSSLIMSIIQADPVAGRELVKVNKAALELRPTIILKNGKVASITYKQ